MVFRTLSPRALDLWIGDEAGIRLLPGREPRAEAARVRVADRLRGWVRSMEETRGDRYHRLQRRDDRAHRPLPRLRDRASSSATATTLSTSPSAPTCRRSATGPSGTSSSPATSRASTGRVRGPRPLRAELGYGDDESVCVVTVGGSGVGGHLLRRVIAAFPEAKRARADLRLIVVCGPRIDPASLPAAPRARGGDYVHASTVFSPLRPRDRSWRADDGDGAHHRSPAVPLLPAAPSLRAELPRPAGSSVTAPAPHGLRRVDSGGDRGGDRRRDRPRGRLPPGGDRRRRARRGTDRGAALRVL